MRWMTALCTLFSFLQLSCAQEKTENDTFLTQSGKKVVITPVKHGSLRISYEGLEIEVDPVINLKPVTDYTTFPKADFILVTHEHGDHCDLKAVTQLEKSSTVLITNPNSAKLLGKGEVVTPGYSRTLAPGVNLDVVPAYNTTPERQKFHPKGRDNGYILTFDGLKVYIAGDTEEIPEMQDIKEVDVLFLPCNLPYTMSPEQVAHAARTLKPKVLFPYHYSETKIEQVSELLKGSGIDVRIRNYQ